MRRLALLALIPLLGVGACTTNDEPAVDLGTPSSGRGLIPQEDALVTAYADCLRANGATVTAVTGIYVEATRGAGDTLTKADAACGDPRTALYKSLEDGREVADDEGNRLWYFVRGCLETGVAHYPRVEQDLLVATDADTAYTTAFHACVDVAGRWPGESPAPDAPEWPVYPSLTVAATPNAGTPSA
ncbi:MULTISPECIES: hypothetical protein [Actinoplanes]|uniref:hypothetical protein n=1 Tax=Actinoplanes TaxID=1865 RepID=UPI0005F2DFBE|nr:MULTISPECIES: hypothetical protein [Actinoplanes]GLY01198.1 hypothetical protein Acsp01_15770 [Actinoplanes sp. NBRC 101535]